MKKIGALLLAAAMIAGFTGCSKKDTAVNNNAAVMFVNACASGTVNLTMDGRVNDVTASGASQLKFLSHSGYVTIPAGNAKLSFFASGLSDLVSAREELTATQHYSAFCSGTFINPRFVFTADNLTKPSSGKAKIRFANLVADSISVNCYFGNSELVTNLGTDKVSDFIEIPAGTGKVLMQDTSTAHATNLGIITSQQFAADKIYTVMFTGTSTGTGTSGFTLTVFNNQ